MPTVKRTHIPEKYYADRELNKRTKAAARIAIERKKAMGLSYVAYDGKNIVQYNPDGTKIILKEGLAKKQI